MFSRMVLSLFAALLLATLPTEAFAPPKALSFTASSPAVPLWAKKPKEDLSYIESRDMTKEEMLDLNKKNEEIMNMELTMMTAFSLVLSLPILYLCWVAFFSD